MIYDVTSGRLIEKKPISFNEGASDREGARIAACDVDRGRLDTLATELGERALHVAKVDVSSRAEMKAFAEVGERTPAAKLGLTYVQAETGLNELETRLVELVAAHMSRQTA